MAQSLPISASIRRYTASTTFSDFIDYLHGTYFAGISTLFEVDPTVTRTAGSSHTIRPISGTWQINIRRTSTTAGEIRIAPAGGITNAGNTSTASSGTTNLSGALSSIAWSTSQAATLLFEKGTGPDDARFAMLGWAAGYANFSSGSMAGQIGVCLLESGNGQGATGLGVFGGSAIDNNGSNAFTNAGQLQIGSGGTNWHAFYLFGSSVSTPTTDAAGAGYAPTPTPAVSSNRTFHVMRDVWATSTARVGGTRLSGSVAGEGFLHIGSTSGVLLTQWDPSVNPTTV